MKKLFEIIIYIILLIFGISLLLYGNSFECLQYCIGCSGNELTISMISMLSGLILTMFSGISLLLELFESD